MAFYRCGGGSGIPPQVNTDMNNVLNKKFSTSGQTYPPTEWAEDVNLLGLLEEKSASSASVCSFSDGADDVPMSSVVAHIAPTLTGKNAVNMVQSGKNLASLSENTKKESQNCTYTFNNGGIDIVATGSYSRIAFTIPLVIGVQYTFSFSGYASGDYKRVSLRYVSTWSDFFYNQTITDTETSYNYTFTASQDHVHIGFYVTASSISGNMNIKDVQIEVGSTPTTYTAYTAPTTYTANLGRTIYGGQADIVNGIGKDGGVIEVFDTAEGNVIKSQFNSFNKVNGNIAVLGTNVRITFAVESGDQSAYNRISNTYTADEQICNLAPHSFSYASDTKHWYRNTVLYLFLPVADVGTTAESVYNYLIGLITNGTPLKFYLPYNTETDFTFDGQEIPSLLGVNNLWHDDGETEVVYRSSGTVTPVVPTLITKSITENGTYDAEDDDADGYSSVTVAVQSAVCERLMYARCVNNDQEEIPAISNIDQGTNYSSYLSYDSTTKKFTVLQAFTGVVVAWVYAYRAYDISRPDGAFYLNNTLMLSYETTANAEGSTGGRSGVYNFKQGDVFWMYTPTRHGYPQQNCKVYLVSALSDNVFTFADEEEE